ncbi:hypothetical protein B5S29_g3937 [[Candida] boidinii]|nr:hypothetical protein B5S29_g3937 [[Candida] boidinii]
MIINKEQDLTSDVKLIGDLKELSPELLYANQSITRSNSNQLTINTMSSFDTNITVSNQSNAYSSALSNTKLNKIVNNDIDLNSTPKMSEPTDMLVESINNLILQPSSNNNEYTHDPKRVQNINNSNNNDEQKFKNDITSGSGITNKISNSNLANLANFIKPSVSSKSINNYMANMDKDNQNNSSPLKNNSSETKGLDDNFDNNKLNVEIISTNSDEHNYSNNNNNNNDLSQYSESNDNLKNNNENGDNINNKKIDLMKRIDANDREYEHSIITNEDLYTPRISQNEFPLNSPPLHSIASSSHKEQHQQQQQQIDDHLQQEKQLYQQQGAPQNSSSTNLPTSPTQQVNNKSKRFRFKFRKSSNTSLNTKRSMTSLNSNNDTNSLYTSQSLAMNTGPLRHTSNSSADYNSRDIDHDGDGNSSILMSNDTNSTYDQFSPTPQDSDNQSILTSKTASKLALFKSTTNNSINSINNKRKLLGKYFNKNSNNNNINNNNNSNKDINNTDKVVINQNFISKKVTGSKEIPRISNPSMPTRNVGMGITYPITDNNNNQNNNYNRQSHISNSKSVNTLHTLTSTHTTMTTSNSNYNLVSDEDEIDRFENLKSVSSSVANNLQNIMKTDDNNRKSVGLIDDPEVSEDYGQVVASEDLSTTPQSLAIEDSNTPVSDFNSPPPVNHSADSTFSSQVEQESSAISSQTPSTSSPESNQKISHSSSTSKLSIKRGFNFKRFNRATITSTSLDPADLSGLQANSDSPQPGSLQTKSTNGNGNSSNSNSSSNFKFLHRKQRSSTVSKISTNNINGHISSPSVTPSSPTNTTKRFRKVLNGNSDNSNNANSGDKNANNASSSSNGSEPISKLIISNPIMTQSTNGNHFTSPLLAQQNHQFQQFQQNDTTENSEGNGGPILADLDQYMDAKTKQYSMTRSPKMAQQQYQQFQQHQDQQQDPHKLQKLDCQFASTVSRDQLGQLQPPGILTHNSSYMSSLPSPISTSSNFSVSSNNSTAPSTTPTKSKLKKSKKLLSSFSLISSLNNNSQQSTLKMPQNSIFGLTIEESFKNSILYDNLSVPLFIARCFSYLDYIEGFKSVGIFRFTSSSSEINRLEELFNSNGDLNLIELYDYQQLKIKQFQNGEISDLNVDCVTKENNDNKDSKNKSNNDLSGISNSTSCTTINDLSSASATTTQEQMEYVQFNEHTVATLLKRYLRKLESPVVPDIIIENLSVAMSINETEFKIRKINSILNDDEILPKLNKILLYSILKYLNKLLDHEKFNKNNSQSLAMLFSINLSNDLDGSNIPIFNELINVFSELDLEV